MNELVLENTHNMMMDERREILLRTDDDYFYDHMERVFGSSISELVLLIENECEMYDRDPDEWFPILLEK
jgi:hypothetical protein